VKKRTAFEYKLKRRISNKIDFIKYIEYEMNLESLRNIRKQKLGLTGKKSISDHSGLRRIFLLFERALKKFGGDIRLWVQYLDYAKRTGSNVVMTRGIARAIQLHPLQVGFWIMAAQWEFETNGNMNSARILLQRALRLNGNSEKLWIEYYKLEWLYVEKIKKRREFLLGEDACQTLDIGLVEGESEITENELAKDDDFSKKDFYEGAIPKVIFDTAVSKISNSGFYIQFFQVTLAFRHSERLQNYINQKMKEDFSDDEDVRTLLASRHIRGLEITSEEYTIGLAEAFEEFSVAMKEVQTPKMMENSVRFLHGIYTQMKQNQSVTQLKESLLERLYVSFDYALASELMTEDLYTMWLNLVNETDYDEKKKEDLSIFITNSSVNNFPSSMKLWIARLDLVITNIEKMHIAVLNESFVKEITKIFDSSLKNAVGNEFELWNLYLSFLMRNDYGIDKAICQRECERCFKRQYFPMQEELLTKYLEWAGKVSLDLPKVYERIFSLCVKPELYLAVIEHEKKRETVNVETVRRFYDHVLSKDLDDSKRWIEFIQFEKKVGDDKKAELLYWKAQKSIADKEAFVSLYHQMVQL
jgi:U3 small nucleolar RNA-associated protein 6